MIFNGPHIWVDQNGGQIWPFPAGKVLGIYIFFFFFFENFGI